MMFISPALTALVSGTDRPGSFGRFRPGMALLLFAFVLLIGLRFEVGGDWLAYEDLTAFVRMESLGYSLQFGDPGFALLTWLSARTPLGSTGPSLFCGAVLVYALWKFARRQPDPWLAVTAAVPYLLIVVGMGYVRQAAAIGFVMLALIQFENRSLGHFFKWMLLAALFHISSLAVLPLVGLTIVRRQPVAIIPLLIVSALGYFVLLGDRLDRFYEGYVVAQYDSSGALVRLLMNAVPAAIFLAYRKRFPLNDTGRALWSWFSILSLLLVALVAVSPSTTALDRIGLYCIPIQLLVFGNIAPLLAQTVQGQRAIKALAIFFYGAVLFTWLNYADNASFWVPYKFITDAP